MRWREPARDMNTSRIRSELKRFKADIEYNEKNYPGANLNLYRNRVRELEVELQKRKCRGHA